MRNKIYVKGIAYLGVLGMLASCGGGGHSSISSDPDFPQLAHVIHAGQSLAQGAESYPVITTTDTGFGNLKFSVGIHTWMNSQYPQNPEQRPASDFDLVPLTSWVYGETISNGLTDQLKSMIGGDTRFLFSYSGLGGRRLRELDKRHDDESNPLSNNKGPGGYYKTSIDDVRRAKAQADKKGWTYGVSAITWMQGEAETDQKVDDWGPTLSRDELISTYMNDLINLKNDWNADIKAITGQTKPIPMFVYRTFGSLTSQAQLSATDADPNIFMVSPTYYMYTAYNAPILDAWGHWIHIDGDSERWLGAQFAKVIQRVVVNKEKWQPLRPLKAWASADKNTVYIQYAVPRKPLVIDTNFLPKLQGYGFNIPNGPAVTNVAVVNDDTLALTLDAPLPANSKIQYAADDYSKKVTDMPPILEVRSGANWANGQPSYEVVFPGDVRNLLNPLKYSGAFYLRSGSEIGVIREVYLDSQGNTVLKGEPRELWYGTSFKPGENTAINLVFSSGNIRDLDNFQSMYTFSYGPRKGQPYPMWNWSVSFAEFPIN